jgi:long-chain acyl-CoA synthetase
MNPAEWLYRSALRYPEAPALFTGMQLEACYGLFARRAAGIAAGLRARGIGPGQQVALFLSNSTRYLEALYGIWWAGAAAVPINGKLHPKEAAWIAQDSEASVVFVDAKSQASLAGALDAALPFISTQSADFEALCQTEPQERPAALEPDAMIWLFYTSGTTGKPKGVMLTCANMATMALNYFVDVDEVKAEDAILYAAPMSHGAGLYNFMHVLRAARHVVPASGGFDAEEILALAPKLGSVSMFAAPTMVRRLVEAAKASGGTGEGLRTIVYAGGPMYEADILEAVAVMGPRFVQIYGQGECPMGITALPRQDVAERAQPGWRQRLASVGRAQTSVQVTIVGPDGQPLSAGQTGEIVVRGVTVMRGYWRNPGASAKTLRGGWLWTGDMGRMDAEGYVTLQDRSKDMIISGGSNVYPREVEEVLLSHPDVQEASVVGQPDPEWGELVVAFLVLAPGADVTRQALDALCLDRIARFKRPKAYHFVASLPKNNYGKVLKTELRDRLQNKETKA